MPRWKVHFNNGPASRVNYGSSHGTQPCRTTEPMQILTCIQIGGETYNAAGRLLPPPFLLFRFIKFTTNTSPSTVFQLHFVRAAKPTNTCARGYKSQPHKNKVAAFTCNTVDIIYLPQIQTSWWKFVLDLGFHAIFKTSPVFALSGREPSGIKSRWKNLIAPRSVTISSERSHNNASISSFHRMFGSASLNVLKLSEWKYR